MPAVKRVVLIRADVQRGLNKAPPEQIKRYPCQRHAHATADSLMFVEYRAVIVCQKERHTKALLVSIQKSFFAHG
jgi:hypothetical protein